MPALTLIPAPHSPAPLSSSQTYTSWPGGVDPTTALYRTDNQKGGKKRRCWSRKAVSRKNRRTSRRASRRNGRK